MNNNPKEIKSYFKIDKKWYGEKKVIEVRFEQGNYAGRVYQYNHDEVYENTIHHYGSLKCWKTYGYFANTVNIPARAKQFVTEIF